MVFCLKVTCNLFETIREIFRGRLHDNVSDISYGEPKMSMTMFKSISKAEFIRRMKIGTEWEFHVSPNPFSPGGRIIRPRTNQRIVLKTSRAQIVFLAGGIGIVYLTFYAGDKCEANASGILRITRENPKVTIQYTPVFRIDKADNRRGFG